MAVEEKYRHRLDHASHSSMMLLGINAIALPVALLNISQELGLSLAQAGKLGFIRSMEQLFVIFIAGIAATYIGKMKLIKMAHLIIAAGLFLFGKSGSFGAIVANILLMGVGIGFLQATLSPLVEDLHQQDSGSFQNRLHAYYPLGIIGGTIVVGKALSSGISWRWVFIGFSIFVLFSLIWYPSKKALAFPLSKVTFSGVGKILSYPKFWILGMCLFFSEGALGSLSFWSASYIQLHYKTFAWAGAVGTAFYALGLAFGRFFVGKLAARFPLRRIMQFSAGIAMLISGSFFFITRLEGLYLYLCVMGAAVSCFWPSLQTYGARVIPEDVTVLMVLISCFAAPGTSLATLLIGVLGDAYSVHTGFIVPSCVYRASVFACYNGTFCIR